MLIKLGEVKKIAKGLNDILGKEIPIKPAYWLGKLAKTIETEVKAFENARLKLVQKYGAKDSAGKLVVEKDKYVFTDADAFNTEFEELADTDIEIDFKPIPLSSLAGINISPVVMMMLENFIVDDD